MLRPSLLGASSALFLTLWLAGAAAAQPEQDRHFSCVISPYSRAGKPFSPEFVTMVDAFAGVGGDTIKVGMPWFVVEPLPGQYDFSDLLLKLDYVILVKGMKGAIQLSLADTPLWLGDEYKMRDEHGNVMASSPDPITTGHRFQRLQAFTPVLSSGDLRQRLATLQREMVRALEGRYPEGSLLYGVTTWTPWMESEYPWQDYADYSDFALADYRLWLEGRFRNISNLNARWGTHYTSFAEAMPYRVSLDDSGLRPDLDLRLLDWNAFRHYALKRFSDELAFAAQSGDPSFSFGLQYGSVYDYGSSRRGTLGIAEIAARADWITIDDSMNRDYHREEYAADLLRATLPGKRYASQLPGPDEGTDEAFREQGLQFYDHGGSLVELGNWDVVVVTPEFTSPIWPFVQDLVAASRLPVNWREPVVTMLVSVTEATSWHERWTFVQSRLQEHATLTDQGTHWADVRYQLDLEHAAFPTQDDYRTDFVEGRDGWVQRGGDWSVQEGQLEQGRTWGLCQLSPEDAYFADSSLGVTVQMGAGSTGWVGVQVRTTNANDLHFLSGYLVRFRPNGQLELVSGETDTVVASAASGLDPIAQPIRLRIGGHGSTLVIRANGSRVLDWTDPSSAFTSGHIGLATYEATASFDDVDLHLSWPISDSFEDGGAGGWSLEGGSWTVGGGALTQSSNDAARADLLSPRYTNAVLTTTVQFASSLGLGASGWAGIHARQARPEDSIDASGYLATLDTTGRVQLLGPGRVLLARGKTALPPIGPTRLQLECDGATLRVRVGELPVLVWTGESLARSGFVGVATEGTAASFADFAAEPIR